MVKPKPSVKVKQMKKANPNDLVASTDATEHTIDTPFGEMTVWVKDLSWIDRQNALTKFVSLKQGEDGTPQPTIDFGGFWKFLLVNCIDRTEPELTKSQLLNIRPEVGQELAKILPSFDSLTESMSNPSGPLE